MMNKYMDISNVLKAKLIDGGSEGNIYLLSDPGYVYKEYVDDLTPAVLKSKMLNVSALMDIPGLHKFSVPIERMVIDKQKDPEKLLGVVMKTDYSYPIYTLKKDEQLIALCTLKNMLEGLKKLHIKYFDLFPDNIRSIGDPKYLWLIDMDSAYVDGIDSDYGDYILINYYLELGGKPDFNAVIYIFNRLTYSLLTGANIIDNNELQDYERILTWCNLNTPRINNFCKSIFSNKVDEIADHEYLINIIDDEIAVSNNNFVFKK